jgi:hypothetical protein
MDESVSKLRASDGALIGTYTDGSGPPRRYPFDLVFDGTHIWTGDLYEGSVSKLRASDGALIGTYPVGGSSESWGNASIDLHGLEFDGTHIWTVKSDIYVASMVSELRASDGALIGTYPGSAGARNLVFDGTHIWTGNTRSTPPSVSKLCAGSTTAAP